MQRRPAVTCGARFQQKHANDPRCLCLPDNAKGAVSDGPVGLHLCGAGHLAGRVAVGLGHRRSAAGAPSQGGGVARGPCRGSGSGQARCRAEARGRGPAGGADTEVLGAQFRGRKQVTADGLTARAVKSHPPPAESPPSCPARRGGDAAPHEA